MRVERARFLGVWVDGGLRWTGQIERVKAKVGQLLGVLGKLGTVLGGASSSKSTTIWFFPTCTAV